MLYVTNITVTLHFLTLLTMPPLWGYFFYVLTCDMLTDGALSSSR